MKTLTIIGGGAGGLMAAIAAKTAAPGLQVRVLERLPRTGKKLLATGNGRCNFTNRIISRENYHGAGDPALVCGILEYFGPEEAIGFFAGLGVVAREEERGKVFPYSGNASAVADALRFACLRQGAEILCDAEVRSIEPKNDGYRLALASGETLEAGAVILAAGGCASPALGSDGSGFTLAKGLGHRVTPLAPALVQLKAEGKDCRPLSGIKVQAQVKALRQGEVRAVDSGEVLFTDYGLSGPPVFQLSTRFAFHECDAAALDLCPELELREVASLLRERAAALTGLTCEDYFVGFLNKRVGNLILRRSGVEKLSLPVSALEEKHFRAMAKEIKNLTFAIAGPMGFQNAQVTAGGVDTREVNENLMSRLHPGLFFCGEVLDVYGDCGGYNLQWAWASGRTAGLAAAAYLEDGR